MSIETGVEKLVKSFFKTSKLNGGVNLSVALPPAPPIVKAVPPDALEAEVASLKLLSLTFMAKYV